MIQNRLLLSMSEELVTAFREFGDKVVQKSPAIMIGIAFLILFIFIGYGLRSLIKRRLVKGTHDPLLVIFIGRVVMLIMVIIGLSIFLNQLGWGKAAGGVLAGAGLSAIILGFAFRDIGENFIAGFFLAFSRGFNIGDIIEVQGFKGKVTALNLRNTHLRTFDGRDIFMPNALMVKSPLSNYTRDGLLRYDFIIGLDYSTDITKATAVIIKALKKEDYIEQKEGMKPLVLLENFGSGSINIRIHYWINSIELAESVAILQTRVMSKVITALSVAGFKLSAEIMEQKVYQDGRAIPVSMKTPEQPEEKSPK